MEQSHEDKIRAAANNYYKAHVEVENALAIFDEAKRKLDAASKARGGAEVACGEFVGQNISRRLIKIDDTTKAVSIEFERATNGADLVFVKVLELL